MRKNRLGIIRLLTAGVLMLTAARAQESPLLPVGDANQLCIRAMQLMESTMITVPGLARAAAPVLENTRQALVNLQASPGGRHAGFTHVVLTNLKAYQALAGSVPKPYPFPEEAGKQFAELRASVERIESHFGALLDQVESRLRNPDRDNLRRYAEANRKLGPPQPNQPRTVFLGDSITDGWRLNEYFPERAFVNRGISGQVTGEMLGRFKADVIDLKPAAVVILAGTNDIARGIPLATIQNNLTMIAALAKANRIKLVFASVLPIHDYHKDRNPRYQRSNQRPLKTILDLNDWLTDFCRRNRHTYLDYFSPMVDANGFLQADLADDGLHPNTAGYRIMAPLAQQAIDRIVPRSQGPKRRGRFLPF